MPRRLCGKTTRSAFSHKPKQTHVCKHTYADHATGAAFCLSGLEKNESGLSHGRGDSRLPPRHSSPSGCANAKRRGSERAVTPGQPQSSPRGSRRVVPRTPCPCPPQSGGGPPGVTGVVIPVRAAWRPLPLPASAAIPANHCKCHPRLHGAVRRSHPVVLRASR